MTFYINQYSELPSLQIELIHDGISDYETFNECIQDATIYFNMINKDTNTYKICNALAYIKKVETNDCTDEFIICYDWKQRDTRDKGNFSGSFTINFHGNITSEDNKQYPQGNLIVPIRENLDIVII